jgi:hypothetical protein
MTQDLNLADAFLTFSFQLARKFVNSPASNTFLWSVQHDATANYHDFLEAFLVKRSLERFKIICSVKE